MHLSHFFDMSKKDALILIILTLLFAAFQLLFLASNMVYLYSYDDSLNMRLASDILIAKKPLSAVIGNITDYQVPDYRGGSLVISILYVPFAYLLGVNSFSLKLTALAFYLSSFILWYIFLNRAFGRKSAVLFAALSIFGTPVLNMWSLLACGNYVQLEPFVVLGLLLLCSLLNRQPISSNRQAFFLGVLCGFSLYFEYQYLIAIMTFIILWQIKDKKFYSNRVFFIFTSGFIIGFLPWLITHLSGGTSYGIRGYGFQQIFLSKNLFEYVKEFKNSLSGLFLMPPSYVKDMVFDALPPAVKPCLGYFYKGAFLFSFVYLIIYMLKNKKINFPLSGIIVYTLIYILVHSLAIPQFQQPRYSVPIYHFVFAVIAVAFGLIFGLKNYKPLKIVLISAFLIILMTGAADNFNLISLKRISNPLNFKGYEYGCLIKWQILKEDFIKDLDIYLAYKTKNNLEIKPLTDYFPYKYQDRFGCRSDLYWREDALSFVKGNLAAILNEELEKNTDLEALGWTLGILYKWDIAECNRVINKLRFKKGGDKQDVYRGLRLGFRQSGGAA